MDGTYCDATPWNDIVAIVIFWSFKPVIILMEYPAP